MENFLENFPITEKVDYRDSTSETGEYKKKKRVTRSNFKQNIHRCKVVRINLPVKRRNPNTCR